MENNELKKRIMSRVYAIWFMKKIAPVVFIEIPFLLTIALYETAREFFVAKIIENFSGALGQGLGAAARFVFSAFAGAPVLPTMVIVVSFGLCGILAYRLSRNFFSFRLVKLY